MVASKLLSEEDRKAVSAAVAEAEKKTSGEIVPVIATTSDRYERAEDLVALGTALLAVTATWTQFQRLKPSPDWNGDPELAIHLPYVLAIFVGGWAVGLLLARLLPWLKRLGVSRKSMRTRVLIAAHHAFDALHVRGTKGATGVVIYVSLFERVVCVWADRSVSASIPEAEWKEACEILTKSLRKGMAKEGFVDAIHRIGAVLAKHLPVQSNDTNELSNELRVLD